MNELLMRLDTNIIDILAIFYVMFLFLASVFTIKILNGLAIYIKNKPRLDRYKIDMGLTIEEDDFTLLDMIIEKIMLYYLIQEGITFTEYITTEKETELCKGLVDEISKTMSPALITRLTKIYNQDSLSVIIANRAYIQLNNYIIQHNSPR